MTGTDWRKGVKGNGLLYETYYYKCGSEYEVPHNRPNQRCLTSDQIDALQAINFVPSDPRGLTHDETRIIDVHKILTFLRNHHVHRMEPIAAGYTWNYQGLILGRPIVSLYLWSSSIESWQWFSIIYTGWGN